MNCTEARAALLDADPIELRGETDSAVALHLRGCAACREAADAILAVEAGTARSIAARAPRRDSPDAIARRRATARRRRYTRMTWLVPLAAAAGIVAVFATRPAQAPSRGDAGAALRAPRASRVAVEAPAGQNVAVFETTDPDIVVIWFF